MTSWRIDLTVLTDLGASMFAACFMVLLIFLSLAQRAEAPPHPIEATRGLYMAERRIPAAGELVELLHDHAAAKGTSIDLFPDHIDVVTATGRTSLRGEAIASGLAIPDGPVRFYVFSNALYPDVVAALGPRPGTEMSVPRALKGAGGEWSAAFLTLDGQRPELPVFRQRLAELLNGGTEGEASAASGDGAPPPSVASGLLERISTMLGTVATVVFPVLGLCAVLLIERRRYRSGQTIPLRGHSAEP